MEFNYHGITKEYIRKLLVDAIKDEINCGDGVTSWKQKKDGSVVVVIYDNASSSSKEIVNMINTCVNDIAKCF